MVNLEIVIRKRYDSGRSLEPAVYRLLGWLTQTDLKVWPYWVAVRGPVRGTLLHAPQA